MPPIIGDVTFLEIQDEVILDRFSEHTNAARRTSVKRWINTRYGRLWNLENWTFRRKTYSSQALAQGQQTLTLTNPGVVLRVYDTSTGLTAPVLLQGLANQDFWDSTYTQSGIPWAYTAQNGVITFDRPASSARTYKVLQMDGFVALSADGDVPLVPAEHHMTLVVGAAAEGLKIEGDPNWQQYEAEWGQAIADLKANYLTETKIALGAAPSWP
jgi:hypothetical protein